MTAAARRPTVPGRSAGKNDKFRRRLRSVDVDTFIVRGPVPVLASGVAGPPELRRPAWVIVASYDSQCCCYYGQEHFWYVFI